MADSKTIDVIKQIHATPYKAVLYVTGGAMQVPSHYFCFMSPCCTCHHLAWPGLQGVSWMLTTPGASRTVLESKVPYAGTSMAEAMGHPVETYACVEVADDLAKAAYRQAANLATIESPIIGVGCTCALATDREKKGVHKVWGCHNMTQPCHPQQPPEMHSMSPALPAPRCCAHLCCRSHSLALATPMRVHAPGIAAAASWCLRAFQHWSCCVACRPLWQHTTGW